MIHWAWLIPVTLIAFLYGIYRGILSTISNLYESQKNEEEVPPESARFEIEIGIMKWRKKDRNRFLASKN